MASWKLIVEDYGKIKSAEIEVAPLTMFVGDNNSGKSYLLALLWGIQKFGVKALIGDKYINTNEVNIFIDWTCRQIDIAVEKGSHEVSLGEVSEVLNRLLNTELEKTKGKLVKQIFNSRNVEIGKLKIELQNLDNIVLSLEADQKNNIFIISNKETKHGFGFGMDMADEKAYRESDFLQWYLVRGIVCIAMNIAIQEDSLEKYIYLPAARTGFMLTKDIINKVGRKNTFNLLDEIEIITPFIRPINQFLDIMGDISSDNWSNDKNVKLALDIEIEMTNGSVEISAMPNKEVQYLPMDCKDGIPLRLSSAVVTELSPLILILKHHGNINQIYYEEPEMCLHPQLQSKMGRMIGRMVNSNIGMIITTHSDILLQHINNMIKLQKRQDCDDICERLGYTQLDLLSSEQVKVYQLRAKIGEKTEVEELSCGENGFVVPTFNDALDEIMNEAYEIQG